MKKFLLLIVGVLFALSANAKWTLYVDISKTGWTDAPYIYCGKWEAPNDPNLAYDWQSIFYNRYQMTKVAENIYKWEWESDWNGLSTIFFAKDASLTDPDPVNGTYFYNSYKDQMNGNNAYGRITNKSGGNWALVNYRCYTLESGKNGIASVVDNFFPASEKYSLRGDFSGTGGDKTWSSDDYAFEKQTDGSFVLDLSNKVTTLKKDTEFKIYDFANSLWAGQGEATISKDSDYALSYGDNIKVAADISKPVFTLTYTNGNLTLKITEKEGTTDPDPDPTDEYVYKLHTDLVNGSWNTYDMFKQADGKWAWAGQLNLSGNEQEFGIKKVKEGTSDAWIWCIDTNKSGYTLSDGSTVGAVIQNGSNGHNFKISEAGFYQIVLDPTKEDNMTVTLTKLNNTLEFTYAVSGNILGDGWKDYKMGKVPGSNWWYLEGDFVNGSFGIKKLDKAGNQYAEGKDNRWGWIHSKEGSSITLGTWNKAVVKGPSEQGTGDWVLSGLATGTKYTIMFDAENMQILVSPVAASGVEDINVDEDAPVEYFNLQGQRVNGELTPGIYIRRQGSTVTKVRF